MHIEKCHKIEKAPFNLSYAKFGFSLSFFLSFIRCNMNFTQLLRRSVLREGIRFITVAGCDIQALRGV